MSPGWILLLALSWMQDPEALLGQTGSSTDVVLTAPEVHSVLLGAVADLKPCFVANLRGADPGELTLYLKIPGDGLPKDVRLGAPDAPQALGPCVVRVIRDLRFPSHSGDPLDVAWPLVWKSDTKGARLVPYPVVFLRDRPRPLPFLILPSGLGSAAVQLLEDRLYSRQEHPEEDEPLPENPPPTPQKTGDSP